MYSFVLRNNFRDTDALVRLGGDEFAVYASGKWIHKHAEDKLTKLLESIRKMELDDGCESLDELTIKLQVTAVLLPYEDAAVFHSFNNFMDCICIYC